MKKFTSVLLALCLCLSVCGVFAACSKTHEHSFATEWSKDATHHWHACTGEECTDVADKAEHTWNGGEITTPATAAADGVKTFTCTACGATKTESVQLRTTITEEEWATNLLVSNFTLTVEAYEKSSQTSGTITLKATSTAIQTTLKTDVIESNMYNALKDGVWYQIFYTAEYGYLGSAFEKTQDTYLGSSVLETGDADEITETFANLTYDETEKAYRMDNLDDVEDASIYYYFENGKLVKIVIDTENINQVMIPSNIGTTTIEVPEFTVQE